MSTPPGGKTIAKLERIGRSNAFQFYFDPSLLDRLAWMYDNVVAPKLDLQALRADGALDKLQGNDLRFHVEPYGSLVWVSADDLATHREFQKVFDRLGLAEAVKPLVDWHERIVMYQGFYVVSNGVAEANWHIDYREGAHAYTLLTPLYDLDPEHGHLLYRSHEEMIMRYFYRRGAGALVGERFLHATEPHASGKPRVLVSMTFGTDRMEHWPVLEKTVGGQSPFVVMPCGHQRGHLRVRLALKRSARRLSRQLAARGAPEARSILPSTASFLRRLGVARPASDEGVDGSFDLIGDRPVVPQ